MLTPDSFVTRDMWCSRCQEYKPYECRSLLIGSQTVTFFFSCPECSHPKIIKMSVEEYNEWFEENRVD